MDAKDLDLNTTDKPTPVEMLKNHAVEMLGRELTPDELAIVNKTAATLAAIKRCTRESIKSSVEDEKALHT